MGKRDDHRPLHGSRRAADRVPHLAVRARQRDVRCLAVPQADVQWRIDRGVHRLLGDVRDVPLPRAVPPDDSWLLSAPDRPEIPAVHRGVVLRRRRVGQPVGEGPRPGPARGWPAAHWRRPAADARPHRRLGMDGTAGGLHRLRGGRRTHQSGARVDRDRRRAAATQRDGVRHQQHVPSGRDRDGNRRARRDLRERAGDEARARARGDARRRSGHRDLARRRRGRRRPSPRRRPRRPARPSHGSDPRRVRRDNERHLARRSDRRARRGGAVARARARQGLRHLRISRTGAEPEPATATAG